VLETHAATRAATAANRDLQATHAALDQLSQALAARRDPIWAALEIQFHRALNDQGGNLVLSSLAERTLRDGLTACPILSPEVLTILHSHHREILRCVEVRDAVAAARRARDHLLFLRDVLVGAARGARHTVNVPLHT
jgi:DNA-binding GntR family transcriptional regulator